MIAKFYQDPFYLKDADGHVVVYQITDDDIPYIQDKKVFRELSVNFLDMIGKRIDYGILQYGKKVLSKLFSEYIERIIDNNMRSLSSIKNSDIGDVYNLEQELRHIADFYSAYPDKLIDAVFTDIEYENINNDITDELIDKSDNVQTAIDIIGDGLDGQKIDIADMQQLMYYSQIPNSFIKETEVTNIIKNTLDRMDWDYKFKKLLLDESTYDMRRYRIEY